LKRISLKKTAAALSLGLLLCAAPLHVNAAAQWQDTLFDHYGIEANGFVETRGGVRLQDDPFEKQYTIAETRLQLDMLKDLKWGFLKMKGDLLGDLVLEEITPELRELNLQFSPLDFVDVKVGRQVLTWGTGDLIFINDMFPKDWQSFFIGRHDEYLKSPSDAVKTSLYLDAVNIDLVYTPIFNNSQYISGERLSYFSPLSTSFAGRNSPMDDDEPNSIDDAEFAARLSKNIEEIEIAFYAYSGFWKEPEGFNPSSGLAYYPRLSVYGCSARTALLRGVGNVEAGYYDSRDNRDGSDPTGRNSEVRFLSGFERELAHDFTGALQYYLEWMQDYPDYERAIRSLSSTMPLRDEYRHMLTLRLTKLAMHQNLVLSLFTYYSPSDRDGYIRPKATYKINDHWSVEGGGNLFWGKENHTFWGRFKKNNNLYAGIRYGF
jgi:hypothetical protein